MFTLREGTVLLSANIWISCKTKEDAAQFVKDWHENFGEISAWTTTIKPEKSGGYSVIIVTDTSSDDTGKPSFSGPLPSI
jgi:hypothetical protein